MTWDEWMNGKKWFSIHEKAQTEGGKIEGLFSNLF